MNHNPHKLLAALYVVFLAELAFSAPLLPERVASHFGFEGEPDGWMSRSACLAFMAVFGIVFPLVLPAIFIWVQRLPASVINIPNRDYWLSAERRQTTNAFLLHHALWLSCLQVGLVIVLHALVVEANRQTPPRLSNAVWVLLGLFLAGVFAWVWGLVRRFRTPTTF